MALEDTLENIAYNISELTEKFQFTNSYGQTIGDELHSIDYNLSRIAEALEILVKKGK
jgi:septation ring formation regulator EzrA